MSKIAIAIIIFIASFLFFYRPVFAGNIPINEFLAHPSSNNKEWVEFYNQEHIDLLGYWLDDDQDFNSDSGSSDKKSLSSLNTSNPSYPFLEFDSFLNNNGDYVVLFDQNGTIVDQHQYTQDPDVDISYGRSPDGTGSIVQLQSMTKGSANTGAYIAPTPTPTPSPTPSSSTTSSASSPTPTPKASSTTAKSPSPKPSTSPAILGESETQVSTESSTETNSSTSPSPSPEGSNLSKTKVAGMLVGSGIILLGLSIGFYLWYKRILSKSEAEKDEKQV